MGWSIFSHLREFYTLLRRRWHIIMETGDWAEWTHIVMQHRKCHVSVAENFLLPKVDIT